MRWILSLVMCIGVSWAADPCPGQWGNPRAVGPAALIRQSCHPAVCEIKVRDKDGDYSVGSGTLVWKDGTTYGVVLSCEHVFRDVATPVDILVTFPSGQFKSKLLTTDPTADLAALVIASPPGIAPVEVSDGDAEPGEMVRAVGRCRAIAGRVLAPRGGWMVVSGQVVGGDSGGPILNATGRLLGVLWGGRAGEVLGSSCKRIRAFLCDTRRKILPWHARGEPCPCVPCPPADDSPPADDPPPVDDPAPPSCDLSEIKAELAELRALIAAIPQGSPGKDGAPGKDGEPGPAGPPGKDGVSPEIDYQEVADKVTPLLPPLDGITFIVQHSNGATETATAYLGDTVILWRDKAGEAGVSVTTP